MHRLSRCDHTPLWIWSHQDSAPTLLWCCPRESSPSPCEYNHLQRSNPSTLSLWMWPSWSSCSWIQLCCARGSGQISVDCHNQSGTSPAPVCIVLHSTAGSASHRCLARGSGFVRRCAISRREMMHDLNQVGPALNGSIGRRGLEYGIVVVHAGGPRVCQRRSRLPQGEEGDCCQVSGKHGVKGHCGVGVPQ